MNTDVKPLAIGTLVTVGGAGGMLHRNRGTIVEGPTRRGEYLVELGSIRIWAHVSKLTEAPGSVRIPSSRSQVKRRTRSSVQAGSPAPQTLRLDLHGMTRTKALELLEASLDRALLQGVDRIELIHGLGRGTLRDASHEYLRSSHHVKQVKLDDANPGVTWVFL